MSATAEPTEQTVPPISSAYSSADLSESETSDVSRPNSIRKLSSGQVSYAVEDREYLSLS